MDTRGNPVKVHPYASVGIDENKKNSSGIVYYKDKISLELLGTTTHRDTANRGKPSWKRQSER